VGGGENLFKFFASRRGTGEAGRGWVKRTRKKHPLIESKTDGGKTLPYNYLSNELDDICTSTDIRKQSERPGKMHGGPEIVYGNKASPGNYWRKKKSRHWGFFCQTNMRNNNSGQVEQQQGSKAQSKTKRTFLGGCGRRGV